MQVNSQWLSRHMQEIYMFFKCYIKFIYFLWFESMRSWIFRYESVGPKSEPSSQNVFMSHLMQTWSRKQCPSDSESTSPHTHTGYFSVSGCIIGMHILRFYKISPIASLTSGLRTIKIGRAK